MKSFAFLTIAKRRRKLTIFMTVTDVTELVELSLPFRSASLSNLQQCTCNHTIAYAYTYAYAYHAVSLFAVISFVPSFLPSLLPPHKCIINLLDISLQEFDTRKAVGIPFSMDFNM